VFEFVYLNFDIVAQRFSPLKGMCLVFQAWAKIISYFVGIEHKKTKITVPW
jgi:hypothetical protein